MICRENGDYTREFSECPYRQLQKIHLNMLDGTWAIPYIGVAMRFYYRAYGFTYRYSFTGERAGETCAAGASKTS